MSISLGENTKRNKPTQLERKQPPLETLGRIRGLISDRSIDVSRIVIHRLDDTRLLR
jgi:hypothetical protein